VTAAQPLPLDELLARSRAVLLGGAVGDALGAPLEFMTAGEIATKHGRLAEMVGGGWLRLKPGQVTDDTEMSLCIARGIIKAGCWHLPQIAGELAGWLQSKPIDIGDTCRRGIRNFMLKGLLETPVNEWDAGNGALMRMGPVALFAMGDDGLLQRCTVEQAHLTHNNPVSDAACHTYGRMVQLAMRGASRNRLRREADGLVAAFPTFRFDPYPGLATGYVVDTLQTVLHYFFRSRSFEECIVSTVNQGGDADTTGAIAGGLAGAYYGLDELPRRWLKKLDRRYAVELDQLAVKLVRLSPTFSGNGMPAV